MPDQASPQPPADDDLDRALRELTEGRAGKARFHEPSAAERATAARQAEQSARQAGQAAKRANRQPRAARRRVSRRQGWKAVAWTAAIALIAGGVAIGWRHFPGLTRGTPNDTRLVTNGAVPSSSASPTGTATSSPGGASSGN